eukprot:7057236-Pyramimonas_sp.AAC.1
MRADEPLVILMTPMRKAFSAPRASNWGRMNPDREKEEEEKGLQAMHLCAQLAEYQLGKGRIFALEHPSSASSWELESLGVLSEHPDVRVARLGQCMHGLTVGNRGPAKKPTTIISNSPELLAH